MNEDNTNELGNISTTLRVKMEWKKKKTSSTSKEDTKYACGTIREEPLMLKGLGAGKERSVREAWTRSLAAQVGLSQ